MARRKKKPSRKERERRKKIARGLRRYHRKERERRKRHARKVVRRKRPAPPNGRKRTRPKDRKLRKGRSKVRRKRVARHRAAPRPRKPPKKKKLRKRSGRELWTGEEFYFLLRDNQGDDIEPRLAEVIADGWTDFTAEVEVRYDDGSGQGGEEGEIIGEGIVSFEFEGDWWYDYHRAGRVWLERVLGDESPSASFIVKAVRF